MKYIGLILLIFCFSGCASNSPAGFCQKPELSLLDAMRIIDDHHHQKYGSRLDKRAKILVSRQIEGDYVFYDEPSGLGRVYIVDCDGNVIFEKEG